MWPAWRDVSKRLEVYAATYAKTATSQRDFAESKIVVDVDVSAELFEWL